MANEEINKKIEELQVLGNHLQNFLLQKQSLQVELNEIANALEETGKSDGEVYKIVSGVMLKSERRLIEKDLNEKKKLIEMKISSIEKQESLLDVKAMEIRKEIDKSVSKGIKKGKK